MNTFFDDIESDIYNNETTLDIISRDIIVNNFKELYNNTIGQYQIKDNTEYDYSSLTFDIIDKYKNIFDFISLIINSNKFYYDDERIIIKITLEDDIVNIVNIYTCNYEVNESYIVNNNQVIICNNHKIYDSGYNKFRLDSYIIFSNAISRKFNIQGILCTPHHELYIDFASRYNDLYPTQFPQFLNSYDSINNFETFILLNIAHTSYNDYNYLFTFLKQFVQGNILLHSDMTYDVCTLKRGFIYKEFIKWSIANKNLVYGSMSSPFFSINPRNNDLYSFIKWLYGNTFIIDYSKIKEYLKDDEVQIIDNNTDMFGPYCEFKNVIIGSLNSTYSYCKHIRVYLYGEIIVL